MSLSFSSPLKVRRCSNQPRCVTWLTCTHHDGAGPFAQNPHASDHSEITNRSSASRSFFFSEHNERSFFHHLCNLRLSSLCLARISLVSLVLRLTLSGIFFRTHSIILYYWLSFCLVFHCCFSPPRAWPPSHVPPTPPASLTSWNCCVLAGEWGSPFFIAGLIIVPCRLFVNTIARL